MDLVQAIKKIALFQNIDTQVVKQMAKQCHKKTYEKGQSLFVMGAPADVFFIVLQGWVKLYRPSKDGEEAIVHIFGPGESFAEAAVFNDTQTYPVNAQAVEETTLIEIPRSFFVKKIEDDSRFALLMLGAIASRQHFLVQQLEQFTTRTAPQRIGTFLLRFCQKVPHGERGWRIDLPYDKSVISTRLNIKPETFSRALNKLKPYGITINRRDIIITDIAKLAEFCELPRKEIIFPPLENHHV